ncbi:MAG TPA: hypothetical protein VGE11_20900 [Pseudonocardia sp.]
MNSTVIVLIIIVVLLVIALGVAGAMLARRRRSENLQEHYGPEYERTVVETGDRRAAEAELTEREKRVHGLDIRDLKPDERERFETEWTDVQRGFVDDPVNSVHRADALVGDIMRTRGYPVDDDFERRAQDISVEHPQVVQHYREARETRVATDNGQVDTERQRHAITSYRALIDALLNRDSVPTTTSTTRQEHTR